MNYKTFFDHIRPTIDLTIQNVEGFQKVIDYGQARGTSLNDMAYIVATAYWETGRTMQPVVEAFWKSEQWRRKNLRYYPWHGRGLIQTTWRDNYIKIGRAIADDMHLTKLPDFVNEPELLLRWEWSLPALFVGMERGVYTGKKLDDYIDDIDESDSEDFAEYKRARRIVNGTDKDDEIAHLAILFEHALRRAGYEGRRSDQIFPEAPSEPSMEDIDIPDLAPRGLWASLVRLAEAIVNLWRKP